MQGEYKAGAKEFHEKKNYDVAAQMATVRTAASGIYRASSSRASFINVFMIIGPHDHPLLFMDLSTEGFRDDSPHLDEFVIHAALDAVDALLVCSSGASIIQPIALYSREFHAHGR
jgi:hypothetical protein